MSTWTEERRKAASERMTGNQYALGNSFSHTPEAIKAISRGNMGKPMSEETKEKLRQAALDQAPASDEVRKGRRERMLGNQIALGTVRSPEANEATSIGLLGNQNALGSRSTTGMKFPETSRRQKANWDGISSVLGSGIDNQITEEQFWSFIGSQSGNCFMCSCPLTEGGSLVVDHNHTTEKVRGIAHRVCNLTNWDYKERKYLEIPFEYNELKLKTRLSLR